VVHLLSGVFDESARLRTRSSIRITRLDTYINKN
jgi:hypothetical protein